MPLVLLHGAGTSRKVFEPLFAGPLAERHRLLAIDLPGHGDSSDSRKPAIDYTLPGYAACVREVIEEFGITRFAVFGWSLGGHVAVQLLNDLPMVAGVMLMGAPPIPAGPFGMLRGFHANWDILLASRVSFSHRDVERYAQLCFGDTLPPFALDDIRRTDGQTRAILSRSLMRGEAADQKRAVEHANVPVALVNGQHDPLMRVSYLSTLDIPQLWDGRVHLLEGAGHAAFLDQPGRFTALLARFASEVEDYRQQLQAALRA